ncbi:hypothetical protein [Stenotrophomonas sp.]|uniref:hypothetical protein n=1 Tax=Stenotrophomonas sp. TaxID=69392 RepID=UPI00289B875F|nr:hypothetical protein [Stenotrophomonas sp.]
MAPQPDHWIADAETAERARRQRSFLRMAVLRILAMAGAVLLGLCAPHAPAHAQAGPQVTQLHGHLELDYSVEVRVDGLSDWAAGNDPRRLVPFIDGRALPGNSPEAIDVARGRLLFHLRVNEASRAVWTDLLGAPEGLRRPVTFSVGPVDGSPFDTVYGDGRRVMLTVISPVYGGIALLLVVVTLAVFVRLARTTSIIRKPAEGRLGPYDLGRFQMAVWFFLIYLSYTAIWLITDATDTIHPSLLALLGISAGTALSEAVIDAGGGAPTQDPRETALLEERQQRVRESGTRGMWHDAGEGDSSDPPARQQAARHRVMQIDRQLHALQNPARDTDSQGLMHDLLSDAQGYRFDRFQIFAFTLILGVIFLSDVYNNLSMPELSPTLLGLMGLSSGTYIGFKLPNRT